MQIQIPEFARCKENQNVHDESSVVPPPTALALWDFLGKFVWLLFSFAPARSGVKSKAGKNAPSVRWCQTLSLCLFLLSCYFSQQRLILPPPPDELADYHEASAQRPDACTLLQIQSRGSPAMTTGAGQMFSGACTSLNAPFFPVGPSKVLSSNARTARRT